jgi:potassium efflux system protein
LSEKAIAADDLYLRKLGEPETAQLRLLAENQDYDAFPDEHLLWVRNTSLFTVDHLVAMSAQMERVMVPADWLHVVRTMAYQATHSPMYALLVVAIALLLGERKRLLAVIRGLTDRLGKPATDRFRYTLLALGRPVIAAAPWPLAVAVTGWQVKVTAQATDFTITLGLNPFLIAMGSVTVAFARLPHATRGVLATCTSQPQRRTFKQLERLWYPLLVIYPLALGVLALLGYLYTAGTLSILLLYGRDQAAAVFSILLFPGKSSATLEGRRIATRGYEPRSDFDRLFRSSSGCPLRQKRIAWC